MAGLYLQVEVLELDADALIDAGMEGRGVYLTVGLLAKRTETDGWVTMAQLRKEGATVEAVDRLVGLTALEADAGGRVRQVGWLDRNPSQAAIDLRRTAKAEAGKRGNHDRWNHPEPFDSCPKCQVVAPCDPVGVASDPGGSPKTESDTESDSSPDDLSEIPSPPDPVVVDEQTVNRCLLRYSRIVTARSPNVGDPDAYAASVRAGAMAEGVPDDLRTLLATGLDVDAAASARAEGSAERDALLASVPAAESAHPLLRSVAAFCADCEHSGYLLPMGASEAVRCACNPHPVPKVEAVG